MNYQEQLIESALFEFNRYKGLCDTTFEQLAEEDIHWQRSETDNSIAIIVKHMVGNMLSRWTNFFTEDGEKPWRDRDTEFENAYKTKKEMIIAWEESWECLFTALATITPKNFDTHIKIRDQQHTVTQAIHRQLTHYAYHCGQIVLLGKMIKQEQWVSLSIAKGKSSNFNKTMFKNK